MTCYVRNMEKDRTFQMRVDTDWLKVLDDWRRQQVEIPSRAEAIRHAVRELVERRQAPTELAKCSEVYDCGP